MATNGVVVVGDNGFVPASRPGGTVPIPITPEIEELACFAVENQKTYPNLVFIKVVSAEKQVVAGMLYHITLEASDGEQINSYKTKVLVQEWRQYKEVVEFKRLPTILGGIKDIPDAPTNLEIIELAQFAVDEHNKKEETHLVYKRVVSATEQVVAGILYRITLEAAADGDHGRLYGAKVLLPAGISQKILLEFKPILVRSSKPAAVAKPGEPEDIPDAPTNLEVIELARFAVAEHNKQKKTNLQFKRVVRASEQVLPAGFLYRITLEAAENGHHGRLYGAEVLLPYGIPQKILLFFEPLLMKVSKQQAVVKPGEPVDIPDAPTNLEVIELARFAVDEHNKKEHSHLEFKRVVKASEQMVAAGLLYRIALEAGIDGSHGRLYDAQVLLPSGFDKKVLLSFVPLLGQRHVYGGLEDVPDASTNSDIIALAVFAVDEYNKEQGKRLEFKRVLSAKQQVVSGMNYFIHLIALEDGNEHEYKAEVWVKPWEQFRKLMSFRRWPPLLPGGPKDIPDASTNPYIISLAVWAVEEYNKEQGKHLEFIKVLRAQELLVAGTRYLIDLVVLEDGHERSYRADVWVKPWEHFKKLLSFTPLPSNGA